MPPAKAPARPALQPKDGAAKGPTPPPSSRAKSAGNVTKGAAAAAAAGAKTPPTAASPPDEPAVTKSKSKGKDLGAAKGSSAGGKPSYMKAKTGKRSKQTREERLQEAIDYGEDGGWTVEKWIDSLQIHKMVADVLAPEIEVGDGRDFEHAKQLTREEVQRRLSAVKLDGLTDAICEGIEVLQEQDASSGADLNHKFHMDGSGFEMSFGSLDLFFGGLEGIIGPPQMINGSLLESMRHEHTAEKDSQVSDGA